MHKMSSSETSSGDIVTIDGKAAKPLLDSGHTYLDVRMVEDFKKGHVDAKKIYNIPYYIITPEGRVKNPEFLLEVKKVLKEEDHLIVGCRTGVRSRRATSDLVCAGFKNVNNMKGGLVAWMEHLFPHKIEEEEEKKQHGPDS